MPICVKVEESCRQMFVFALQLSEGQAGDTGGQRGALTCLRVHFECPKR